MSSAVSPDMTLRQIPFMLSSIEVAWFFCLLFARRKKSGLQAGDSGHGLQRRLLVLLVGAELRNVRPRSPHAERFGSERELPRPVARFFLGEDVLHADRVLVDHPVRPFEVEEAGRGGRGPACGCWQ